MLPYEFPQKFITYSKYSKILPVSIGNLITFKTSNWTAQFPCDAVDYVLVTDKHALRLKIPKIHTPGVFVPYGTI